MRAKEINPSKLKIFIELDRPLSCTKRKGIHEVDSEKGFPTVARLSDHKIFFEDGIEENEIAKIKKMAILIFSLGRWKEYSVVSFKIAQDKHKGDSKDSGPEQTPSLDYTVEEKNRQNFRNELLLALI